MLNHLTTEQRNPHSESIDCARALEIVALMNREDAQVAAAVRDPGGDDRGGGRRDRGPAPRGGRLVYLGAGTSGRLGVLDASECPPTFSTPPAWWWASSPAAPAHSPRPSRARKISRSAPCGTCRTAA